VNFLGLSSFVLASPFTNTGLRHLAYVRDIGYDIFELCVEAPELLTADAVRSAAERVGLQITVCGAFGVQRDVSHEDPAARRAGIGYLRQCVDLAAVVGSPHVAGPMYSATGKARMLPSKDREQQWTWAATSLREVADYAAERGVRLAIEPLNRFETDLINTVEQGLRLCERIGRDNVGLLLDTFHMNIEEKNIGDAIRQAGGKIFHFQAAENDRGTPGSGHLPWNEIFEALRDIDYRGAIVVESFLPTLREIARAVSLWRPVAPSMDTLARDGLAFLRSALTYPQRHLIQ
jgi:D-psicose/D-tagatose/L-ribulose 3-epimerase